MKTLVASCALALGIGVLSASADTATQSAGSVTNPVTTLRVPVAKSTNQPPQFNEAAPHVRGGECAVSSGSKVAEVSLPQTPVSDDDILLRHSEAFQEWIGSFRTAAPTHWSMLYDSGELRTEMFGGSGMDVYEGDLVPAGKVFGRNCSLQLHVESWWVNGNSGRWPDGVYVGALMFRVNLGRTAH